MFGIGPTELIVILVIALLVLGPKRLPELAAGLGKGLAEFRRATADINAELDEARRAVEEPAKEAARATAVPGRISRTSPSTARAAAAAQPEPPEQPMPEDADEADDEDDSGAGAKPPV